MREGKAIVIDGRKAAELRRAARALLAALDQDGAPGGDDDGLYMTPIEAISLLRLGDVGELQRRSTFEKLREGLPWLRRRLIKSAVCVHAGDWLAICRQAKRLSPRCDDWTAGLEALLATPAAAAKGLATSGTLRKKAFDSTGKQAFSDDGLSGAFGESGS